MTRLTTTMGEAAMLCLPLAPGAPAAAGGGNVVKNPGFERSLDNDVWRGEDCCVSTESDAHSGQWLANMGSQGTPHTDKISQRLTLPRGDSATLVFWLKIETEESGTAADTFQARVAYNGNVRTVKALSSADATGTLVDAGTWVRYTAPMHRYTGDTVTLSFVARENQGDRTDFKLDDVAVRVS